jgi:hypothetical protein
MRSRILCFAGLLVLLAGCGPAGAPHQPRSTDPQQLQVKLRALMADECYASNARSVYPACNKYITELSSTVNEISDVLPGKPAVLRASLNSVQKGMGRYSSNNCGPQNEQPQPSKTTVCAGALTSISTGIQQLYDGLYGNQP